MAFVQSVTGKKLAAEARVAPRDVLFQSPQVQSSLAQSAPVDETAGQDGPVEPFNAGPLQAGHLRIETSRIDTGHVARPSPVLNDVRQEIRGRVAAFRAHQELFNRQRNEYCDSVLTRVRASTGHAPGAPDDQPSKP
jgi:hypothetical protein